MWTDEEDRTFIKNYNEFCRRGRLQRYSLFVASVLPCKMEKQVCDQVRTLQAHGIIVEDQQEEEPHPPEAEKDTVLEPTLPVLDQPRMPIVQP